MAKISMSDTRIDPRAADDAELVESARNDPAALAALYRRYLAPVYRYLYHRVGSADDAEDLASQVFIEALEGLVRYQERGNFAAWLFTIARRKAIAFYRRKHPHLPLEDADQVPEPAESLLENVAQNEKLGRMAALFSRLDEEKQEMIRLHFTAGLTYAEIGALLGRSETAVKTAVHRALRQMQEWWEE